MLKNHFGLHQSSDYVRGSKQNNFHRAYQYYWKIRRKFCNAIRLCRSTAFFCRGCFAFFAKQKMGKALTQAKKEIFPLVVEHSKKINQFFALQKGAAFFRKSMHSKAHENRKMFNYFHNCMYYYNIFCYSAGIFYDMLQICFCSVEKKELFLQFTDIFLVTFFSIFLKLEGQQAELLKLSLE